MYYFNGFKENALAITDSEVSADWRMGLLRATAKLIRKSALPSDSTGSYGVTIPGSNREHINGGVFGSTVRTRCELTEIYDVDEDRDTDRDFDSYGGSETTVVVLRGKATCACGRLIRHPVSMTITPGNLIQYVVTAED